MSNDRLDIWVMGFAEVSEQTARQIMSAFAIERSVAERLMSSAPLAVKRELEPAEALELRRALEALGATVRVVETGSTPASAMSGDAASLPPPAASAPAPAAGGGPSAAAAVEPEGYPDALPLPDFLEPPEEPTPPIAPSAPAMQPTPASRPAPTSPPSGVGVASSAGALPFDHAVDGGGSGATIGAIGRRLVLPIACIAVLCTGVFVWDAFTSTDSEPGAEGVDERCDQELSRPHMEARRWLESPRHVMLGLADASAAIGIVNRLYSAGAQDIQVTRIQGTALQQTSGTLVVELPPGGGETLFEAATQALVGGGGRQGSAPDGSVEMGDRFLRVVFTEPLVATESEADLWQTEKRLRESSRREQRGLR